MSYSYSLVPHTKPMGRSLLWIITLSLPIIFLGLLAYLLKDSVFSINWSQLRASDLVNLGALAIGFFGAFVAIGSLFVAVSQLQQAIKDGEEQRQSLDASRKQLEAVVESVKKQHELQAQSLETSKALLATQERVVETTKKQHEVQAQSLETSKSLLSIQEEERKRLSELASRKAEIQILIGEQVFDTEKIETTLTVGQDNTGKLLLSVQNIGLVPLHNPIFIATASRKDITVRFDGTTLNKNEPYRTQLSKKDIEDLLPVSTSNTVYETSIFATVAPEISDFDMTYTVTGINLKALFRVIIHVHIKRS